MSSPLKTNISPENNGWKMNIPFELVLFLWGYMLVFRCCIFTTGTWIVFFEKMVSDINQLQYHDQRP